MSSGGATVDDVASALAAFELTGPVTGVRPLRGGHIHDTYAVDVSTPSGRAGYVAQRLNERVFTDLDALMGNLVRVVDHLTARPPPAASVFGAAPVAALVRTRSGATWARDRGGRAWRVFARVDGASSRPDVGSDQDAERVARAFGELVARLGDLPAPPLVEVIAGFHDLDHRIDQLADAARDPVPGRAAPEVVERARRLAGTVTELRAESGYAGLPRRTVHNDTKVDNLLRDDVSGAPRCVVDLDTVGPGLLLVDLGELCRTAAATAAEDERDLDRVGVDPARLAALTRGFVAGCAELVTLAERASLALGPATMAVENGVRFLADHLRGDRYFRVQRADHNLDRALAQLTLAARFLDHRDVVARAADV